jgi:hypothetical protein
MSHFSHAGRVGGRGTFRGEREESGEERGRVTAHYKKPVTRQSPGVHKDAEKPGKSPELHAATFEFHFGNAKKFTKR